MWFQVKIRSAHMPTKLRSIRLSSQIIYRGLLLALSRYLAEQLKQTARIWSVDGQDFIAPPH